jgi:hypothetical protein
LFSWREQNWREQKKQTPAGREPRSAGVAGGSMTPALEQYLASFGPARSP